MSNTEAEKSLSHAKRHLERVLAAWDSPTDWEDLTIYGFYCLEASVVAAALHIGLEWLWCMKTVGAVLPLVWCVLDFLGYRIGLGLSQMQ